MTARVLLAAPALLALLAVGCAAGSNTATGTNNSPVSATARRLPSPFTITARYTAASLGLNHPDSMAIGPDGNLYVTDYSQRVTVISPTGKVLRRWGKPGRGPGQFRFANYGDPSIPTDIAGKIAVGADGKVYVSDSGNARVQVFTAQGRFLRQFGRYGGEKGQFLLPGDIAVDNAGNVYVADSQSWVLFKFSTAGHVIWQIGGVASSDPDMAACCFNFTSLDAHGRLVAVDDGVNRVLYIDSSGHKVDAFSPTVPNGHVCEVTVDAAGVTYVSGCGPQPDGPTLVYDPAHRLIAEWPGTRYSMLRSPVFGPHGEVFALATDGSILRLHITVPGA